MSSTEATDCVSLSFLPSRSAIIGLFLHCSPSAIRRFVVPVVVHSFNRQSSRFSPHVIKEKLERLSPSLADSYSPVAVVLIVLILLVVASIFHARPCLIFWTGDGSSFVTVAQGSKALPMQASTTLSALMEQMFAHDKFLFSAQAFAGEIRSTAPYDERSCKQSSKPLAYQFKPLRHIYSVTGQQGVLQ